MKRSPAEFVWPLAIAVLVGALATWAYFAKPPFLEHLELSAYDLRLKARGPREPSGQVAIVAVDEVSLEHVGRWPWDRSVSARLASAIDAAGAKAVAWDVVFSEPQVNAAGEELARLVQNAGPLGLTPTPQLKNYLRSRLAETNQDFLLAKALAGSSAPQVLGYYFNLAPGAGPPLAGDTLARASRYFEKVVGGGEPERVAVPRGYKPRTTLNILASAATSQAYFNVVPDEDGSIRRYQMAISHEGVFYQPLAASLFSLAVPQAPPMLLVSPSGMVGVEWERHVVPTDDRGRMMVNYRGPAGSIPSVPAWKLLRGQAEPDALRGKYVFVGVTAPTVYDLRVTPFSVAYPGLEIHATVLDNMLTQEFIRRPTWAPLFDLASLWIFVAVTVAYLWRARTFFTLAGFALLSVGFFWANMYFFTAKDFWLNMVYPMAAFAVCYVALNTYRYAFADRQKKEIRRAFSKYLDPGVVEQVTDDPDQLHLGGRQAELTVLFSDIRDFTSISERMTPEELVGLLNVYLTAMTRVVLANKGLLDKYIGDAIMAVFGAPFHYPEHPRAACETALTMVAELDELNARFAAQGGQPLRIGIGLNTGGMIAGNMGSEDRFDYTVIGDNVNLASRLEGLSKIYGVNIVLSASTQERVGEFFWTRTLDMVRVKGREEPVEIFELLARIQEPQPLSYMAEYLEMVMAYREGRFAEAHLAAETLAEAHPEDKVLCLYRRRLTRLCDDPPENWDGICTFSEK